MPAPYHSKPSLDNAFARVTRAEEHLARLGAEIDAALKGSIKIPGGITGRFEITGERLPEKIPILIGELVYNLRAALDYLMYQLVYLDSGKTEKGTKFPIEDHPNTWQALLTPKGHGCVGRRRWKPWLPLLTPRHQAAIEALQPFKGCRWTSVLRTLSNPDKHYDLIVTSADLAATISSNPSVESFAIPPIPNETMDVQGHFSSIVTFDDGSPIVETLKKLQKEVATVLTSFNRDFQ